MKQYTKTKELYYKMKNIFFNIQTYLIMTNLSKYIFTSTIKPMLYNNYAFYDIN